MKFKKLIAAVLFILVLYLVIEFSWSILNTQTCIGLASKNATCEQIASYNTKNCKYVFLKWKKVDYNKELQKCKDWESSQVK